MAKSNYLANKDLDHRYGGGDYTRPATVYIGLSQGNPTAAASGLAEPSGGTGGSYARVAVTNNATNFPAASGQSKANGTKISFPTPTTNWGTGAMTHWASFDASSGGNMLDFAALDTPKTINSGDDVSFEIGDLEITES